jgi:hypothetical protein
MLVLNRPFAYTKRKVRFAPKSGQREGIEPFFKGYV